MCCLSGVITRHTKSTIHSGAKEEWLTNVSPHCASYAAEHCIWDIVWVHCLRLEEVQDIQLVSLVIKPAQTCEV
jgi:hypothetical protein